MRYRLDVLDESRARVATLTGVVSARLHERVNGLTVLMVETVAPADREPIRAGTRFIRLTDDDTGASATFRIMETATVRRGSRASLRVTARALIHDTEAEVFAASVNCYFASPQSLMDMVLAHSGFSAGTVEPTGAVPFARFDYEPVADCLMRICTLTGGELRLDETEGRIDLLDRLGADNGAVLRYGTALADASRTVSTARLANRIYGIGAGEPPLTLTSATASGGVQYTGDDESVSLYGVRAAVYHDAALQDVVNLVATPALNGEYDDGLCVDWGTSGSPVLARNADPARFLYGAASQKVTGAAAGDGIRQDISVTPMQIYSLSAMLFVESGLVRVKVTDGATVYRRPNPVTGSGLVEVRIENFKPVNSEVTVSIVQEGSGTSEFYVDAVQLATGARVKPFTVGKSADTLYARASEYLAAHKDPEVSCDIGLVLPGEGGEGPFGGYGLGDTVRVIDPSIDLDVATRVMERELDLLRPWKVAVRLDSASRTMADTLAALRTAQEEGVRRQRALLTESSAAAEAGSARLGFASEAFRFYGVVTVTGEGSLSWSAGTLRVGNGWYTVSGGSASGLAVPGTAYFYFDRTAPSAIGHTTDESSAEGEDRILLFAVTTSGGTPCVIHPLGVIHV